MYIVHTHSLYGPTTKLHNKVGVRRADSYFNGLHLHPPLTSTLQDQVSSKGDNQMFGLQLTFHE